VIGPSASGKSTLGRALVGVWPPAQGAIRLDGATLDQWSTDELGVHIGYLPQEVELLSGTIAENISRFDAEASSADIFEAAVSAGVHEMIVSMPNGYKTEIGEDGSSLSGGQRQRIGLARALYKNPFLLVLDEPNSNLDSDGETALNRAITRFRDRGSIVIVIAHKLSLLGGVDKILFLRQGKMQAFGPRDDILSAVLQPSAPTPGQSRVDHGGGRAEREAMTDAG
jgi:ABC-type protease/lipase transport system fused ATPase/permease subunit